MKLFIKQVLAVIVGLFATFAIGLVVLTSATDVASAPVESGAILVIDLSGDISDRGLSPTALEMAQGASTPLQLRQVLRAIKDAASDDKITGIFMHGSPSGYGWAASRELHHAFLDFRDSKKPIYAWFAEIDEITYYFGATASQLWSAPFGSFQYDGFAAEISYYGNLLEKLGVNVQVSKVGKYKSAVEPFTLSEMSDANREQTSNFLGDLFDICLDESSAARGIESAVLSEIVNGKSTIKSPGAQTLGLIDGVLYFDQVLDQLAAVAPSENGFVQTSLEDYISAQDLSNESTNSKNTIALVYAEGSIYDGRGSEGIAGDTVAQQLRELRNDDEIGAVVLRVNSGGGSASASEYILREVELLRTAGKPVVVSMGNVAASGGYWIASRADKILVQPNTITGSIGVFGMFPEMSGLLDKVGVKVHTVKTGPFADAMSINRPRNQQELAAIQEFIDEIYDAFIERVASGRGLDEETVRDIAQGRVWSGIDAIDLGLVDGIGGIDDAAKIAAKIAGMDNWELREPGSETPDFIDSVINSFFEDSESEDLAKLQLLSNALPTIPRLGASNGVYALLPFSFSIK